MESLQDSSVTESQTSYYLELRSTPRKMFRYLEHIFKRKETEVESTDPSVDLHVPLEWGGWGEVPIRRRNGFDLGWVMLRTCSLFLSLALKNQAAMLGAIYGDEHMARNCEEAPASKKMKPLIWQPAKDWILQKTLDPHELIRKISFPSQASA